MSGQDGSFHAPCHSELDSESHRRKKSAFPVGELLKQVQDDGFGVQDNSLGGQDDGLSGQAERMTVRTFSRLWRGSMLLIPSGPGGVEVASLG